MKKRIITTITALIMLCTMFSNLSPVSAATITEASFVAKIAELQKTFVDGQYWNKYSSSDYSRTGNKKCKCTGTYCAGTCSCQCGQFYYNNKWYGGQCHGYALKLGYLIFGSVASVSWSKHYNAYNIYAGDLVRINKDKHSFFVYKVDGNTIYYTECNNSEPCQVKWGRTISKSDLAKKLTYVLHNSSYKLSGTGTAQTTVNPVHADTTAHVRNGFFTLKNASSGKFLNVFGGKDQNTTPITVWAYDDSTDQQFNIVHKGNGKYKLYAYASSNGTNRVVDVYRNGGTPAAGQSVDLWTPDDDTAQLFYIVPLKDGSYVFELASKDGYVIAPSSASAANTDGSQLTLQLYTGADYQKWRFCNNNGVETYPVGSYSADVYQVNTNGVSLTMRSGAGTNYSKITSVADGSVLNVTNVNGNWGYTSYNGNSGWVCLDFTVYAPTITSISMYSAPYLERFFVGDTLDTTGMEITATYSNGSTQIIDSGFTTTYDFSSPGMKTVIVNYAGKTTSFTIDVDEIEVSDLAISTPAIKTEYNVGDTIDTTGLELLASYNNGATATITSGYDVSYDFSSSGTKTVTITYAGVSTTYSVTVTNTSIASLTVNAQNSAQYGDEIDAIVSLSNAENVYDGNFNIEYDNSILELTGYAFNTGLNGHNPVINEHYASNLVRVTFAGTTPLSDGNLLTLNFKVISDKTPSTAISLKNINMYNISGNAALTTSTDALISIVQNDYTITDYYMLDTSDNYITEIPTSGSFYVGISFNKNSEGTSRPCIIYGVYDNDNKLICFTTEQNRYSQRDNLTCETLISLPQHCSAPKYIKCFIWNSISNMQPLSNCFSTK